MRISFNPLFKSDGTTQVGALTSAPANNDITFDLPGQVIYARGIKFGGGSTYTFTKDAHLNLTVTSTGTHSSNVDLGVNLEVLREALLSIWDISVDKASFSITTEWKDSGVNLTTLSQGVYIINIDYEGVLYSGTFSLNSSVNTDDEIMLHECGNRTLNRGRIYAKINADANAKPRLMLAASKAETNISKFAIKIKQVGKL